MAELYGRASGSVGGRGGTMHLYDRSIGLFGTNGVVASGAPQALGAAISAKYRGTDGVAVAFFGDGATNHGAFHEALNLAGIRRAPVVFVCENNLYATATPLNTVTLNPEIATRAAAYGIPGVAVDGNDVVAMWTAMQTAAERARAGEGPTLIEAKTYRTVGHHEGDPVTGTYRTQAEVDEWAKRCPVVNFRTRLIDEFGISTDAALQQIEAKIDARVQEALEFARAAAEPDPATVMRPRLCRSDQPARRAEAGPAHEVRRDLLARRRARRHRRGDAARTRTSCITAKAPASAAAPSRTPRGCTAEFGARADGRHADQRAWLHRRRPRRLRHRPARDRRPDVRRFPVRGRRPDRSASRQAALHEQRPDERADGDPRRLRHGAQRRPAPQRHLSSGLGAYPRPDRLHAGDAGRRQRPDENRPARR